jgi:putative endonuclease
MSAGLEFGRSAESMAAAYLKRRGFKILEKNYRTRFAEIDLIARDGDTLVFVEVKARRSSSFGVPKDAVNFRKQQKISMAALAYLRQKQEINARIRFDVVAVCVRKDQVQIEIVKNAFEFVCSES